MSVSSNNLTLIPKLTIHPDKICLYKEINWSPSRVCSKFQSITTDQEYSGNKAFINSTRKNNGYISDHAKRKLFRSLNYMLVTSDKKKVYSKLQHKYITFRIVFVTFTLPSKQIHSDKIITNQCFNQLLIELQRYHNVNRYIWRAEKQNNGNIHYHLIINEFIEYQELRKRWNRICNKLGYVDEYQSRMKNFYKDGFRLSDNKNDLRTVDQQRKAYIIGQKSDWRSPNSTDIHDTRSVKNIKNYLGKYISKNPELPIDAKEEEIERLTIHGRLWSTSHNLANIKGCQLIEDWELSDELEKVMNSSKCKIYKDSYFSVYYINAIDLKKNGSDILYNYFSNYLIDQFDYHLQVSI